MRAIAILSLLILPDATPRPPDWQGTYLNEWPPGCAVVCRAPTWGQLAALAKPDATFKRSLFLWCKDLGQGSWLFDLAEVFEVHEGMSLTWAVLGAPENWMGSGMECEFMTGRAGFPGEDATLVARSPAWGEIYNLRCPSVPGGAKGQQWLSAILAWHEQNGRWNILWRGQECDTWNLGFTSARHHHEFNLRAVPAGSAMPFGLSVRERRCDSRPLKTTAAKSPRSKSAGKAPWEDRLP